MQVMQGCSVSIEPCADPAASPPKLFAQLAQYLHKMAVQAQHCWPMSLLQSFASGGPAQEPTLLCCCSEAALCMSFCSASRPPPAQLAHSRAGTWRQILHAISALICLQGPALKT